MSLLPNYLYTESEKTTSNNNNNTNDSKSNASDSSAPADDSKAAATTANRANRKLLHEHTEFAILVKDLTRKFGKSTILSNINMTLPKGAIYGLLGPSGCGKTTFLKCLLARLRPTSGSILAFDETPGSIHSFVPGRDVGYMPQEIALYDEFTVHQHFTFYSRLFGMKAAEAAERETKLRQLLDIPTGNQRCQSLSGGQARRVSLALALLHRPKLLLADEPTVGVDPRLRQKIWEHFVELATTEGTSIIITTHYIEEARQADYVAMMRRGTMLEEGRPDDLILKYKEKSLEDVFLKLCNENENNSEGFSPKFDEKKKENDGNVQIRTDFSVSSDSGSINAVERSKPSLKQPLLGQNDRGELDLVGNSESNQSQLKPKDTESSWDGMKSWLPRLQQSFALTIRNIMRMIGNIPALVFIFFLPSLQIILFCSAIGKPPHNLPISVVANNPGALGNTFIQQFYDMDYHVYQYTDEQSAISDAENGRIKGYIKLPDNYTENMPQKNGDLLHYSIITYRLDYTDQQTAVYLTTSILKAYGDALDQYYTDNSTLPAPTSELPIQPGAPLFGSPDYSFSDYIAPGMIIVTSFSQSIGLTALAFVLDKKTGNMDRSFAAGVRASEVMASQAATQVIILLIQTGILLFFGLYVFALPNNGSWLLVYLICMLLGMTGMFYGLFIASFASDERNAMQVALGSFFPALLLSGIIWPIEAIPVPLNYISYILPTTWSAESGRSIMGRGWGLDHQQVWMGFVVTLAWSTVLFILAARSLRVQIK
jgi:ABC-type multidrug transport system ATPase subunit/ABC-type multidrug transport system permease subunit